MVLGIRGHGSAPQEVMLYTLCKDMGWTIQELYNTPSEVVKKFWEIRNILKDEEKSQAESQNG